MVEEVIVSRKADAASNWIISGPLVTFFNYNKKELLDWIWALLEGKYPGNTPPVSWMLPSPKYAIQIKLKRFNKMVVQESRTGRR